MAQPQRSALFNENDIRPENLMTEQEKHMLADIDFILQFKDQYVAVACPACGSTKSHTAFNKYSLDYKDCSDCGTLYINPRPSPEHLEQFYKQSKNYEYWNTHIFPASSELRRERIFKPRVQKVKEICADLGIKPQTLVEVGAGFGLFCDEVQKDGFAANVVAVEPTPSLAETCRGRGLNVMESTIEKATFAPESVDVLCSFEVIEHLFNPGAFIEQCSRFIKPGGLVILSNPNGKGFDVFVSPQHSGTVDVEHLNYFNPASMELLFNRYGFDVINVETPGKLDADIVRNMFLQGNLKKQDNPFLHQILVENWDACGDSFQAFLANNKLSSHMWTVARKK